MLENDDRPNDLAAGSDQQRYVSGNFAERSTARKVRPPYLKNKRISPQEAKSENKEETVVAVRRDASGLPEVPGRQKPRLPKCGPNYHNQMATPFTCSF